MRLYFVTQDGNEYDIDTVKSFTEAVEVADSLEERWKLWEAAGYPDTDDIIAHYEGCDVYLTDERGVTFWLDECNNWERV